MRHMKIFKRILLAIIILLIAASIGGYFYFRNQFKAQASQFETLQDTYSMPFQWISDSLGGELNPYSAMVLSVTIPGCGRKFRMQFDLGSPSSLFYKNKMEAINLKYRNLNFHEQDGKDWLLNYSFTIAQMKVTNRKIRVWPYDASGISWTDTTKVEIIGTIGSDIIDDKILIIDYPHQIITLTSRLADSISTKIHMTPFKWEERKVLLPVIIHKQKTNLYFDTGSSAFSLLTDHATWKVLSRKNAPVHQFGVNSWGKTLTAFTAPTDYSVEFNSISIPIMNVTYIEGTSFIQNLLMRFSGMGGMTGNKLFLEKTILIDTRKKEFGILQ